MNRLALIISGLSAFSMASAGASGVTALKKVQVTEGNQVDLIFDAQVSKSQIKVDYINDIIQISIQDVSVYPAKIFSVSGSELTKVFAYQYAPKLVRTRLTVKGKADNFKNRLVLKSDGKLLSVRFADSNLDKLTRSSISTSHGAGDSSKAPKTAQVSGAMAGADKVADPSSSAAQISSDEQVLLDHVLKSVPGDRKDGDKILTTSAAPLAKLAGAKPMPSPLRTIATLVGLLLLFGVLVLGVRKLKNMGAHRASGGLGKLIKAGLGGIAGKEKMIEVVANHYLGPKKSISVIKVCGRILVLGVSNEAINLIAQFSGDGKEASVNTQAYEEMDLDSFMKAEPSMASVLGANTAAPTTNSGGAMAAGKPVFSDLLKSESNKPSIRAQIRSRVEGLKQL